MASLCTDNQDVRLPVKAENKPMAEPSILLENLKSAVISAIKSEVCRFLYPHLEAAGALKGTPLVINPNLFCFRRPLDFGRLNSTIVDATAMIEEFRFAELHLYRFVWMMSVAVILKSRRPSSTEKKVRCRKNQCDGSPCFCIASSD